MFFGGMPFGMGGFGDEGPRGGGGGRAGEPPEKDSQNPRFVLHTYVDLRGSTL